jgi:RPA family protein
MADIKKRETAYKLRIGEILNGTPIIEDVRGEEGTPNKERFRFLEISEKRIIRVNLLANVIDKFNSEGDKKFATLTVDDATGQIRLKLFGEDISKFENLNQGDTILIIGLLRSYNNELYISPEIIKKIDPKYLLIRKLEKEKNQNNEPKNSDGNGQIDSLRGEIIKTLQSSEDSNGIETEQIILKLKSSDPSAINSEIIKLIEDGVIFEPRPGRVRYLG